MTESLHSFIAALLLAGWLTSLIGFGILIFYIKSIVDSGHSPFGGKKSSCSITKSYACYQTPQRTHTSLNPEITMSQSQMKNISTPIRDEQCMDHPIRQRKGNQNYKKDCSSLTPLISDYVPFERFNMKAVTRFLQNTEQASTSFHPEQRRSAETPRKIPQHQREFEDKCRQLLEQLQLEKDQLFIYIDPIKNKDFVITTSEQKLCIDACKQTLNELRKLFETLGIKFAGDRPGYITTMILCCNVIIELDALHLVKSLQPFNPDMELDSQFIIETVVPNIWSM